ncbi:hypothetical protein [Enterovirga aerilata]|uniref:hypothetical protein n=1 Tax=Enterovirga aerilata TaxID=2730920 RepID=UPI0015824421|nr:hypothetical protein [Enterovirga sp. DB1703]
MKTDLIATKAMRYGGRSLEAGDAFRAATPRDARILTAIRKAELAPDVDPEEAAKATRLDELRSEYEAVAGEAPDLRWGAPRLEEEIEAAKKKRRGKPLDHDGNGKAGGSRTAEQGRYNRRDVRAED